MAILKHLSSKSANYKKAVEYLMYEQDRLAHRPLRNEDGCLIMRENFLIDSLECSVPTFDAECRQLNRQYQKNQKRGDIKSHHYIISFDPKDSAEGNLTMKDAQRIGMEYARRNFPGHQAIVCTHDDGENKSGNIHVHIIINSLRKRDVTRKYFMERECDCRAGYKHHLTDKYLEYLKIDLMDVCKREKLHQVDLLSPAKKRVTEREYWAKERGKAKKGERFRTNKDKLRFAIDDLSSKCTSEKQFATLIKRKYNITFKISRGKYSYILPNYNKAIRGRALGTNYTEEYLRGRFKENAKNRATTDLVASNLEKLDSVRRKNVKYPTAFAMNTKLPFVRDLQISAITTTNRAIDRNMKITNLMEMANTIMYMEKHGIESRDALDKSYQDTRNKLNASRSALKRSEDGIKALNEQIHYTGQYLSKKGVYQAYMKARNKSKFRSEHEADILLFEAARRYLRENADDGTLPSLDYIDSEPGAFVPLNKLKSVRAKLIEQQKKNRSQYYSAKNEEKRLYAIKRNVDNMLKEPSLENQRNRSRGNERE